jgi:hypothetical protein
MSAIGFAVLDVLGVVGEQGLIGVTLHVRI